MSFGTSGGASPFGNGWDGNSPIVEIRDVPAPIIPDDLPAKYIMSGGMVANERQREAIDMVESGNEFCLIGGGGTGKSTTFAHALSITFDPDDEDARTMHDVGKHLDGDLFPFVLVSFTNQAVNVITAFLPRYLKGQTLTIHKLLEYTLMHESTINVLTGETETKRWFEEQRTETNPIREIKMVIFEEGSMIDMLLFSKVQKACPNAKFIFLGDLNQLPPIFNKSVLGWALCHLPTVELTHVYRTALRSPIKLLSVDLASGKTSNSAFAIRDKYAEDAGEHGKLEVSVWTEELPALTSMLQYQQFIKNRMAEGLFDPKTDVILCPFVKEYSADNVTRPFSAINIANGIASYFDVLERREVFIVDCGFNKKTFAVGDIVFHNKSKYKITGIEPNALSRDIKFAPIVSPPSREHRRWAIKTHDALDSISIQLSDVGFMSMDFDNMSIDQLSKKVGQEDEDTSRQASYSLKLIRIYADGEEPDEYDMDMDGFDELPDREEDDGREVFTVSSKSAIGKITLAYAQSVHASQGSQFKRVYLAFHASHRSMMFRELLYTGITRAKEHCHIMATPDLFKRCTDNVKIQGNTLEEKIAWIRAKVAKGDWK